VIGFGIAMALVARASPRPRMLDGSPRVVLVLLLAAAAVAVVALGITEFRRARTTVNPLRPEQASAMVQSGVYRYTRNPMYLGMLLALGAWCTWLGHPLNLALLALFVPAMNKLQIEREEHALAQRFPAEFADYRHRVRRWI
jgi:protein-S-isoprenylcysteine O-methyltransferase Ste14